MVSVRGESRFLDRFCHSGGSFCAVRGEKIRNQLAGWFGSAVERWEHLRTYRIAHALPVIEPRWTSGPDRPIQVRPGTYLCGDHRENPSIQGAVASGRRAAERVQDDLQR